MAYFVKSCSVSLLALALCGIGTAAGQDDSKSKTAPQKTEDKSKGNPKQGGKDKPKDSTGTNKTPTTNPWRPAPGGGN